MSTSQAESQAEDLVEKLQSFSEAEAKRYLVELIEGMQGWRIAENDKKEIGQIVIKIRSLPRQEAIVLMEKFFEKAGKEVSRVCFLKVSTITILIILALVTMISS